MGAPIAIFFHCMASASSIAAEQMRRLVESGLPAAATQFTVGINANPGTASPITKLFLSRSRKLFHGEHSKSENRTIMEIERWVKTHPGWYVLYFHTKGASKPPGDKMAAAWRDCMMRHNVTNWRQCVKDLDAGHDAVGCHWIRGLDDTQHYFAGNFWWAKSSFLATVPPMIQRPAIRKYGPDSIHSRYEAEVWLGNGWPLPIVKDYHTGKHW